ncbi:MAG: hypothetical protein II712_04070 [Erysipelotrichaceae bacterium]|nr:hypothetical protein [Erysipelotrichaceae bacterium]
MPAAIIIAKILTAAAVIWRIYLLISFRLSDTNVRFKFDLLSMIAIDGVIAVTLVAVLSTINETTYVFTLVINLLALALNLYQSWRTVVAGDKRILLGFRSYDLTQIKGISNSRISLYVHLKNGSRITIPVPLTASEVLRKMKHLGN